MFDLSRFSFGDMFEYWFLQSLAMVVTALFIPRLRITSLGGALVAVLALGFVNATIWDAALFLSIPQVLSARAALLLLANGVLFWLVVKIVPGVEVRGVLPALVAPVVFTACSLIIGEYGQEVEWMKLLGTANEAVDNIRGFFLS